MEKYMTFLKKNTYATIVKKSLRLNMLLVPISRHAQNFRESTKMSDSNKAK